MSDDRDRPLSSHWRTVPETLAFLGESAGNSVVRSIVVQAYLVCRSDPERWISYSRRKVFYKRSRYRRTDYTYTTVTRAIDFLDHRGWIEHRKAPPGNRGWQSSFRASAALMAEMSAAVPVAYEPVETLILRTRRKELVEYRDSRSTARMRRDLCEINEAVASVEIAHPELGIIRVGTPTKIGEANPGPARQTLCRIFTDSFEQNGRFYGAFWINMKGVERKRLTINGSETAEPDQKGIHPTLLYAQAGATLDGDDPYDLPDFPRKLVKVAFNTMVNARQRNGAAWSVMQTALKMTKAGTIPEGYDRSDSAKRLLDAIEARHTPIRGAFYSDAGIRLMSIESRWTEAVVLSVTRSGSVALPVHDSFITPVQCASNVSEAMEKAMSDIKSKLNPCAAKPILSAVPHTLSAPQNGRDGAPVGVEGEQSATLFLLMILPSLAPPQALCLLWLNGKSAPALQRAA